MQTLKTEGRYDLSHHLRQQQGRACLEKVYLSRHQRQMRKGGLRIKRALLFTRERALRPRARFEQRNSLEAAKMAVAFFQTSRKCSDLLIVKKSDRSATSTKCQLD